MECTCYFTISSGDAFLLRHRIAHYFPFADPEPSLKSGFEVQVYWGANALNKRIILPNYTLDYKIFICQCEAKKPFLTEEEFTNLNHILTYSTDIHDISKYIDLIWIRNRGGSLE